MKEVTCPNCQYGLSDLVAKREARIVCPECGRDSTARELLKSRVLVLRLQVTDILVPLGLAASVCILSWIFLPLRITVYGVFAAVLAVPFVILAMSVHRMHPYRMRTGYWGCLIRASSFRLVIVWGICALASVFASFCEAVLR